MSFSRTFKFIVQFILFTTTFTDIATARKFTKVKDAVRLQDVKALTFHKDRQTTHRRVSVLPQLTCVAGSGCPYYEPDNIRCVNSGSSYDAASIEWTCTSSLPPEFKLGSTEVICEGYDDPDDEYVLRGSCALEYRLLLTDLGYEMLGGRGRRANVHNEGRSSGEFVAAAVFWMIFALVGGYIAYSLFKVVFRPDSVRRARREAQRRNWRGGWDDGDDDDPPPPYTPFDTNTRRSQKKYSSRPTQAGSSRASSSRAAAGQNQDRNQRRWWQNFGTGAVAGSAAGWLAANAMNSRRQQDMREREQPRASGSWFGGSSNRSGSTTTRQQSFGSSDSLSGGISSSRYESTGFGGTRRR